MHSIQPRTEEGAGAVLRLSELSVTFETPRGDVPAVRDVSLTVGRGECVGVVGESGAGKTQLFLAALGLLPAAARVSGGAWLGLLSLNALILVAAGIGLTGAAIAWLGGKRLDLASKVPFGAALAVALFALRLI